MVFLLGMHILATFRDFLYDSNLVENTRWLSNMKRVSKYCVEGERGFIKNHKADGNQYLRNLETILKDVGWL